MKADLSDFRTAQTAVVNERVVLSLFGRAYEHTEPLTLDDCQRICHMLREAMDDIYEARAEAVRARPGGTFYAEAPKAAAIGGREVGR